MNFDTCCQRSVATCAKLFILVHIYIFPLNYCSRMFLKSFSYLYEVVRTNFSADFWTFRNFWLQFRETWRHLAKKWEVCSASDRAIHSEKKCWKPHKNRPINRHTILVWTVSPTHRQTKRDIQKKTSIFALTTGALSSISPKLCMLIENVLTILKGVNHFSIQRIVFPAGAKMLIFGHWRTE